MHIQSEKTLRGIARDFIQERDDIADAFLLFREEAIARYSAEVDGDDAEYFCDAVMVFRDEEGQVRPGRRRVCLRGRRYRRRGGALLDLRAPISELGKQRRPRQ